MRKNLFPIAASALLMTGIAHAESSNDTSFNPKISVILDGAYYSDNVDGDGIERLDEMAGILGGHGHEEDAHGHGGLSRGFNLRETELTLSGTVDPYLDAWLSVAFADGEAEVEEAYFETRGLPAGWKIKGGKFLSGVGYHNAQHLHSWDFADQNLAYLSLFGDHGLVDSGVQVTYQPATSMYTLLGAEVLQGDQEKLGASLDGEGLEEEAGPHLTTFFAKAAPDLGADHALQFGLSYIHVGNHQEDHGDADESPAVVELLEGEANVFGIDTVYKMLPTGSYGQGGLKLQAEYFYLTKDLTIEDASEADEIGEEVTGEQDGFYIQAVYGFAPRWSIGARYSATGMTNDLEEEEKVDLGESSRTTLALTWYPTEFSKFRLQFARANISVFDEEEEQSNDDTFNQILLQYNISLGAHGAHQF
ncbi:hypothetical protein A9Q99_17145 [Gammaproteobacteria bacterium 45_16_T64]|nr:hypothetical protein A9Q99_17145 [Gammaproteobacteria bacterium 45_16_T64]